MDPFAFVSVLWGMRFLPVCLVCLALGCSRETQSPPTSAPSAASASESPTPIASTAPTPVPSGSSVKDAKQPIGQATMKADRSIVLDLFRPAHLQETYPPSHPEYKKILEHVGPLEPGQQKLVMPWPDDIDDAKVEATVHAWAEKQKWDKSSYRFEIVGTDKDGNVTVSVSHAERRIQLRLSPKTYAVVKEIVVR